MDVVIAGGHGQIARRLASLLTARGDTVRGLIRNPGHAADVRGDRRRAGPVRPRGGRAPARSPTAIEGADAVVFAAGAGPGQRRRAQADDGPRRRDQAARRGPRRRRRALRDRQLGRRREPAGRRRAVQRLPAGEGGGRPGGRWRATASGRSCARAADRRPGHRAACASRASRSAARSRATTSPRCWRRSCAEPRTAGAILYVSGGDDPIDAGAAGRAVRAV